MQFRTHFAFRDFKQNTDRISPGTILEIKETVVVGIFISAHHPMTLSGHPLKQIKGYTKKNLSTPNDNKIFNFRLSTNVIHQCN
jgi:hypothetical protein